MPVHIVSNGHQPASGGSSNLDKEIAKLRSEVESLKKQKSSNGAPSTAASKLPLYLAALSLLVSIVALFRH